jgi:hypothetical protein
MTLDDGAVDAGLIVGSIACQRGKRAFHLLK